MKISIALKRIGIYGVIFLAGGVARAAELSGNLSTDDIRYAGAVMGFGSNHRAWTAPAIASDGLGLDLGLESSFVFRRDLQDQGNAQGVLPRIIPVPRLWASWDFPGHVMVSASLAPGWLFGGVTAIGLGGQWTFAKDESIRTNFSALATYTYVNAFDDLGVHLTGLAAQASRDLETWQPYVGAGLLVANATIKNNKNAAGVDPGPYTLPAFHLFVGVNLNLLGKCSAQIDIVNRYIGFALLIAQRF